MHQEAGFIFTGPTSPALLNTNIGKLLDEKALDLQDKPAIISRWQDSGSRTYSSLRTNSQQVAQGLLEQGVRPNDIVVALAGNSIEYAELFLAVGGIGATFAIINPTFSAQEVLDAVDLLKPKAIVIAERIGFRSNKILIPDLAKKASTIQLGGVKVAEQGILEWNELKASPVDSDLLQQYWAKPDTGDSLCIQFTSGTTGPKKAGVLTHENLVNNAFLTGDRLGFTSADVLCCCPPLFHCFGLVCSLLAGLCHGCKVILPSEVFNAEASIRAMAEERCTVINAVPTMFQAMLDYPHAPKYAPKFSLRTGIIAGSTLSETLLQRLSKEFGLSGLAYAFGMTELSAISFLTTPSRTSLLEDRSSVGTLMPHTAAKVVDENLITLPPGSRGELLVSGYLVFKEYYANPDKSREAVLVDPEGQRWLRTGDLVTLDYLGACRVVGRSKDMIKKSGENIAPADVEKVLEMHPAVATAAVFGIPDSRLGETVAAFIQRSDEAGASETTPKQLRIWMRDKIAPHKIPEHMYWIGEGSGVPDQLPINASGKILKNELSAAMSKVVAVGRK